MPRSFLGTLLTVLSISSYGASGLYAHDHTSHRALHKHKTKLRAIAAAKYRLVNEPRCQLAVKLRDADSNHPIPGIIRITRLDSKTPIPLPGLIAREQNWYTMRSDAVIDVPKAVIQIEAIRGIETDLSSQIIDLSDSPHSTVELRIQRFSNLRSSGWRNGNTHLHLMNLTLDQAHRYLRQVPQSDDLELVYLSHLRRIPDEKNYISNQIVEQGLTDNSMTSLSHSGVLLRPGEEHRHNFGRGGQGFGHVMLLDISRLVRPVSIGSGIMRSGTDGIPLQRGMRTARMDGGTVIWCHNAFGFEDIPNWVSGTLDAQNIFDGGNTGSYRDSFYRYLNIGLKVPFSTGTDWFIDDFSRVFVSVPGVLSSQKWLDRLAEGRTFISNGPLLEFTVGRNEIGDTIRLSASQSVKVHGTAVARMDFSALELVYNGKVIERIKATSEGSRFRAAIDRDLVLDGPGWIALRTALDVGNNEFGQPVYSHTSPVYVEFAGRSIFHRPVAEMLCDEIERDVQVIQTKAVFENDQERKSVLEVYKHGLTVLRTRIEESSP